MDLIKGKTIYCPTCGERLSPEGAVKDDFAQVEAYCSVCNRNYRWVAYKAKDGSHEVSMFREFLRIDNEKE